MYVCEKRARGVHMLKNARCKTSQRVALFDGAITMFQSQGLNPQERYLQRVLINTPRGHPTLAIARFESPGEHLPTELMETPRGHQDLAIARLNTPHGHQNLAIARFKSPGASDFKTSDPQNRAPSQAVMGLAQAVAGETLLGPLWPRFPSSLSRPNPMLGGIGP